MRRSFPLLAATLYALDDNIMGANMESPQEDQFPAGMRVLAVDDNVVCLKLLQGLLEKCHYQVTITTKATVALKLLREDRDRFDMVITDVMMPDMDGFQLLELVGLEMDLPVIMISACSDTEAVMKGVTHGACDYLVKPVRMEEIKNIWQHVVRRRNSNNSKQQKECDRADKSEKRKAEDVAAVSNGPSSTNGEEDSDGHRGEDGGTSTRKKPRVVWTVDLHQQFVAAVNQLGVDKAVPKKILEIMNVDYLTRENVASHLQKFRLYLKKANSGANHQANALSFGGHDSSNLTTVSLNDLQSYEQLSPLASFQKGTLTGGLNGSTTIEGHNFGRQNYSSSLHYPTFLSPEMEHLKHLQNNPYYSNNASNFTVGTIQAQQKNLIQRVPSFLGLNLLQQHRLSNEPLNSSSSTLFPTVGVPGGGSSSLLPSEMQGFQAPQEHRSSPILDGQLPTRSEAQCVDPFLHGSVSLSYTGRPLSGYMESAFLSSAHSRHGSLFIGKMNRNISSFPQKGGTIPSANSSNTKVSSSQFSFPVISSATSEFVDVGNMSSMKETSEHTGQVEKDTKSKLLCAPSSSLQSNHGLLESLISGDSRFENDLASDGQPSVASPSTSQKFDSQHGFQDGYEDPIKFLGGSNFGNQSLFD